MQDYTVFYTAPNGQPGELPVAIGDPWLTIDAFVEEFLFDHPGWIVTRVAEEA